MNTVNQANSAAKSNAKITGMISDVTKNQTRFYVTVQSCLMQIAWHAMTYNDYSRINDLIGALGKGTRKQCAVRWAQKFMGLTWDEQKQHFKGWKDADYIRNNIERGRNKEWHTMGREEVVKAYDINADIVLITNHINKAKQRLKDNPSSTDKLDIDPAKWNNLLVALGLNNAMEVLTEVKKEQVA